MGLQEKSFKLTRAATPVFINLIISFNSVIQSSSFQKIDSKRKNWRKRWEAWFETSPYVDFLRFLSLSLSHTHTQTDQNAIEQTVKEEIYSYAEPSNDNSQKFLV